MNPYSHALPPRLPAADRAREVRGMSEPPNIPPGVNPDRSSVARVYGHLIGGKDAYGIDLGVVEQIQDVLPDAAAAARENRNFMIRMCRFLAFNEGVRQYIDCGSGLPTTENVHQVVQRADPDAKVVYVDYDPVVITHCRALLGGNDNIECLQADFFDPLSILDDSMVQQHLNWNEPIAVLFLLALHHHTGDRGVPAAVTKEFIDRLPSGSYLAITHLLDPHDGSEDDATVRALLDTLDKSRMDNVTARTAAEIKDLFHGLDLVPPGPGREGEITLVGDWWPDGPLLGEPTVARRIVACGIARKPWCDTKVARDE
uniref:SAM-dependent methyltransferase n=1 Tax=Amycolatopsis sp. CA-096443 TaxID=3239919 RepID=UPI003F495A28